MVNVQGVLAALANRDMRTSYGDQVGEPVCMHGRHSRFRQIYGAA